MGIEVFWKQAKAAYRGRIAWLRVNKEEYSNFLEVTDLLTDVTQDQAKVHANRGWLQIKGAKPILSESMQDSDGYMSPVNEPNFVVNFEDSWSQEGQLGANEEAKE